MESTSILDSAVSSNGTVSTANLFELDKYEIKEQQQTEAKQPVQSVQPISNHEANTEETDNTGTQAQALGSQEPSIDAMAYTEIVDAVMSRLLVIGCRFADKKATVADFKLSEAEKKKIAPLVQKTAEKYMLYASVEVQLAILCCAMYGGRFLMVVTDEEKNMNTKKKPAPKAKEHTQEGEPASRGRGRPRKD